MEPLKWKIGFVAQLAQLAPCAQAAAPLLVPPTQWPLLFIIELKMKLNKLFYNHERTKNEDKM